MFSPIARGVIRIHKHDELTLTLFVKALTDNAITIFGTNARVWYVHVQYTQISRRTYIPFDPPSMDIQYGKFLLANPLSNLRALDSRDLNPVNKCGQKKMRHPKGSRMVSGFGDRAQTSRR